jgi:hypothetical protein
MTRATSEQADLLHRLVAEALIEQIEAWKDGRLVEPCREDQADFKAENGGFYVRVFPAPLLAQAVKFLKDNEVTSPHQNDSRIDRLKGSLPSMDDLDNVVSFPRR